MDEHRLGRYVVTYRKDFWAEIKNTRVMEVNNYLFRANKTRAFYLYWITVSWLLEPILIELTVWREIILRSQFITGVKHLYLILCKIIHLWRSRFRLPKPHCLKHWFSSISNNFWITLGATTQKIRLLKLKCKLLFIQR